MSELNVLALALFLRCVCICASVYGAVILAQQDKAGWGWLLFLAICLANFSFRYTND